MNLKTFKEHNSLVVLTSENFFHFINNDNRKVIHDQLEMNFRSDDKLNIPHQVFYTDITMIDYSRRDVILGSLKKLLSPLKIYLNNNLPQYLFHDSLGSSNSDPCDPYNIANKYHIKVCKKDGTQILKKDFKIIQDEIVKVFIEANKLIKLINEIGEDETVLSLILTKIKENRIHPVIYENVGASLMVYELFNFKKSTPKLPLSFYIGFKKTMTLISPKSKYHEATLEKTQLIQPAQIAPIASKDKGLLGIKGFYFDNNSITQNRFDEKVYCKDKGENKDESERIYNFLLNNNDKANLLVAIRPSQPYLCHEGINAKKYKIIGLQEMRR